MIWVKTSVVALFSLSGALIVVAVVLALTTISAPGWDVDTCGSLFSPSSSATSAEPSLTGFVSQCRDARVHRGELAGAALLAGLAAGGAAVARRRRR